MKQRKFILIRYADFRDMKFHEVEVYLDVLERMDLESLPYIQILHLEELETHVRYEG